jgi:hypothetical protein
LSGNKYQWDDEDTALGISRNTAISEQNSDRQKPPLSSSVRGREFSLEEHPHRKLAREIHTRTLATLPEGVPPTTGRTISRSGKPWLELSSKTPKGAVSSLFASPVVMLTEC